MAVYIIFRESELYGSSTLNKNCAISCESKWTFLPSTVHQQWRLQSVFEGAPERIGIVRSTDRWCSCDWSVSQFVVFIICWINQGPRSYFESGGLTSDSKCVCVCVWGGGVGGWKHLFHSNSLKFPKSGGGGRGRGRGMKPPAPPPSQALSTLNFAAGIRDGVLRVEKGNCVETYSLKKWAEQQKKSWKSNFENWTTLNCWYLV